MIIRVSFEALRCPITTVKLLISYLLFRTICLVTTETNYVFPLRVIKIGTGGKLDYTGNYVSFMDTMLQFGILGIKTRELYLPTRLQRVVIDPIKHKQMTDELSEDEGK